MHAVSSPRSRTALAHSAWGICRFKSTTRSHPGHFQIGKDINTAVCSRLPEWEGMLLAWSGADSRCWSVLLDQPVRAVSCNFRRE